MPWIFIGGAVLALAGAGAVIFFMRRRAVERRSMYASRRSQIEHKVRAARQRTLAPHSRSEKPADVQPGPGAPATFGLKEAMPTIRFEPSAYQPPPAMPPPPVQAPGVAAQSPWETKAAVAPPPPPPAQTEFAPPPPPPPQTEFAAPPPPPPQTEFAPPPPPPPSGADTFAEPFGALPSEMPPPPPPEAPWTPTTPSQESDVWTPAPPPPPEQPWTPGPPQFEAAMPFEAVEPEPMTIPPPETIYVEESVPEPHQVVTTSGWSVVAPAAKPSAEVGSANKPSKKERPGPNLTESWLLATASPDDEEEAEEAKPNMSRALTQYAILVVGLVMVLIGVIVMVANSH